MNQRITVISHFTREEVIASLRLIHPWIPDDAQIAINGIWLSGLDIEYIKSSELAVSREE